MRERLTRTQWIDHGLRTLRDEGAGGLRADRLAKSLGVSRGSFYWHFADLAAFHAALLDAWRARMTEAVIRRIESEGERPESRARALIRRALSAEDGLERAVRAWAAEAPEAAKAARVVDERRLAYLERLFAALGRPRIRARALYWAYLGRVTRPPGEPPLSAAEIEALADLFLGAAG